MVKQKHTLVKVKHFNDSKAFIAYSNDMSRIYKNIEKYNLVKKRKTLMFFDDKIANVLTNKKLNPVVTELYIRARKLTISLAFTSQSYFFVPKNIKLNFMQCFIMKFPRKRELQQTTFNHSSDIDF